MSQWTAAVLERVWGKSNLVEINLPLHLFNPHIQMGNNANNMPPTNKLILSVRPRPHHLAAVVMQVGKKEFE